MDVPVLGSGIGGDCSLAKARRCFRESNLIVAAADWVVGSGKKQQEPGYALLQTVLTA